MSFKKINELRKSGKLDEALEMVNQNIEADPSNIWNKRAAAWVYYGYLKKLSQPDSFDAFKDNLLKLKNLELPEDENMVFDNAAWQIGKVVLGLQKQHNVDYKKIDELYDIIRAFHFSKPSESYTFIYKAFHKGANNWSRYLEFADWWDFDNFRPEDYLKEEFDGKKIMSITEQAYIAYSKKLLIPQKTHTEFGSIAMNTSLAKSDSQHTNAVQIHNFLPRLEKLISNHPEYKYPSYYNAKLLLALGDGNNSFSSFLPFAKHKKNDFWVWELMAEIFPNDKNIQFACYCKALSLKTPEDFLVKLRVRFAEILIKKQMYNEAKTEILKVIDTRKKHDWKLPNKITDWTKQDWYKSASHTKHNQQLYSQYVNQAEELLFQDIPEEVIVVEFVNKNKQILNFIKNKQKFGFFKYSGQLNRPQVGDILMVRFDGEGKNGFYKILTAKKAEPNLTLEAIKAYKGRLKVISPQNFGFVDNVFVMPKLIQNNSLTDGQTVAGKAILSFNKKKNEWGWKAIEIELPKI